jgi:hypothetical protein
MGAHTLRLIGHKAIEKKGRRRNHKFTILNTGIVYKIARAEKRLCAKVRVLLAVGFYSLAVLSICILMARMHSSLSQCPNFLLLPHISQL